MGVDIVVDAGAAGDWCWLVPIRYFMGHEGLGGGDASFMMSDLVAFGGLVYEFICYFKCSPLSGIACAGVKLVGTFAARGHVYDIVGDVGGYEIEGYGLVVFNGCKYGAVFFRVLRYGL